MVTLYTGVHFKQLLFFGCRQKWLCAAPVPVKKGQVVASEHLTSAIPKNHKKSAHLLIINVL